jgi:hypothetical protein
MSYTRVPATRHKKFPFSIRLVHVLSDCSRRQSNTDFQLQFRCNSCLSPRRVLRCRPPNQHSSLRPPRRTRLPCPEQTKSAAINSLTSKSGQPTTITRLLSSSTGIAQNRVWHSTALLSFGIGHTSSSATGCDDDKSSSCGGQTCGLRSGRLRVAQSGTRRRHPSCKRVRPIVLHLGNWLTAHQGKTLLSTARNSDLRSKGTSEPSR